MNILYIAGSDSVIHPNHRAHHFINFLEYHANRVDVISLKRFYSGPWPADHWTRLRSGLRDSIGRRVEVIEKATGIQLVIRKLPGRLNPVAQDLWAYLHLEPLDGRQYDLCIFGNPENVLLPLLLKKKGIVETVIYDDWDYYFGFDRSWLWKLLMRWREHISVSIADIVISVGSLLAELRNGQGARRTLVVPNGVDYQLFAVAQQKKPHPPTLIYLGKLADEYGVDVSIKGFALVREKIPDARYLVISYSEGQYVNYLHSLVDELKLSDRVLFLGAKRYEELPQYLAEADIGVALFKSNELMRYAFPLKIVEYMAAGLAVVGTKIGETETLICEAKSGEAVGFSSEEFAQAVVSILSDKKLLKDCSNNASRYAKKYDWGVLFDKLIYAIGIE
jgi:glycosyltransferase involved in cell wall biosynthesis